MNAENKVKVGISVMIMKDNKILLGKRIGKHGSGQYAFIGGNLEYSESFEECIVREVAEEADIKIKNIKFLGIYNLKEYMPKHYLNILMSADWESGEPKLMEPDRCEGWQWYDMDDLPIPLFVTVPNSIESYRTGRNYYDK